MYLVERGHVDFPQSTCCLIQHALVFPLSRYDFSIFFEDVHLERAVERERLPTLSEGEQLIKGKAMLTWLRPLSYNLLGTVAFHRVD